MLVFHLLCTKAAGSIGNRSSKEKKNRYIKITWWTQSHSFSFHSSLIVCSRAHFDFICAITMNHPKLNESDQWSASIAISNDLIAFSNSLENDRQISFWHIYRIYSVHFVIIHLQPIRHIILLLYLAAAVVHFVL